MLIFGHVGITTGVIKLYEKATRRKNSKNNKLIDYRLVMVGSMLPDIIDKPLVEIIYGLNNHEGHFIAHSFIFSGLIIVLGISILIRNTNKSVLLLGICSLIHQIFDKLISIPNTISLSNLNSGYFVVFNKLECIHDITTSIYIRFPYLRDVVTYFEKPYVFISEVLGLIILVSYYTLHNGNKDIEKTVRQRERGIGQRWDI